MDLNRYVRAIRDFPHAGVIYRDISPLLGNAKALRHSINMFANLCEEKKLLPDYVVGIEARGFIFGAPLAYLFNAGFIPVRKAGKLPSAVYEAEYVTEYSRGTLEIHRDAILKKNARVLVVDDLLASGGTAHATLELLDKLDCTVIGFACLIELNVLRGRSQLPAELPVISLLQY